MGRAVLCLLDRNVLLNFFFCVLSILIDDLEYRMERRQTHMCYALVNTLTAAIKS